MSTEIENTIPIEPEEVFTDLSGNVVKYSTMSDEHDIIKIIEKVADIKNIGRIICGEENSNMLTFEINRYYDNVDLKDKDICIIYKNSLGTFKENAVNVQYSENHLRFSWVLSYNMASVSGNVIACINFLGEDEFGNSYSLKTANFKLSIDNALNITSVIVDDSKNWFVDIENRLKKIENNGGVVGDISYSVITNKPKINGVTLEGNKTLDDLNIQAKGDYANANHTHNEYLTEHQDLSDYALKSEIPTDYLSSIPEEYVTETELSAKGYLTEHQDISELVNKSHNHDNKSVIDKFSVSDSGTLLFDGSEIKGSSTTTGNDGKSAYEIAVDNGFVGTEAEWLESLKGEPGKDGAPGQPGVDGTPGADGYTPVRGTDYWTAEDKAEIQSYIDSQIGGVLNGSY